MLEIPAPPKGDLLKVPAAPQDSGNDGKVSAVPGDTVPATQNVVAGKVFEIPAPPKGMRKQIRQRQHNRKFKIKKTIKKEFVSKFQPLGSDLSNSTNSVRREDREKNGARKHQNTHHQLDEQDGNEPNGIEEHKQDQDGQDRRQEGQKQPKLEEVQHGQSEEQPGPKSSEQPDQMEPQEQPWRKEQQPQEVQEPEADHVKDTRAIFRAAKTANTHGLHHVEQMEAQKAMKNLFLQEEVRLLGYCAIPKKILSVTEEAATLHENGDPQQEKIWVVN